MSALATTELSKLPAPGGGGGPANVQLHTTETRAPPGVNAVVPNPAQQLAEERRNRPPPDSSGRAPLPLAAPEEQAALARAVAQAAGGGVMPLPPADVPRTQGHLSSDPGVQPQRIAPPAPQAERGDYIGAAERAARLAGQRVPPPKQKGDGGMDEEAALAAVLAGVLFLIVRLPPVQSKVLSVLPGLYGRDGAPTTRGFVLGSLAFGATFYGIIYAVQRFGGRR